ncbi:hypothetical protein D3C81_2303530 [compost metagenome]
MEPIPNKHIIRPIWLMVEKASSAFRSLWRMAFMEPIKRVISPTRVIVQNHSICPPKIGVRRATR